MKGKIIVQVSYIIHHFHPNNFRKYDGITTTHNIRLEHLFDDFKHIFQKYNLDFKIDGINSYIIK